jgi:hypothetical protein
VPVISGYHVDEYCVEAFRAAVGMLRERFGAEKITDFSSIGVGDLIARVPPKIRADQGAGAIKEIPVYLIGAVGSDFDDAGNLVPGGEADYLYFQASECYLIDLNSEESTLKQSAEAQEAAVNCFDARELGRIKPKYNDLAEDLKGILYRIPAERLGVGSGEG